MLSRSVSRVSINNLRKAGTDKASGADKKITAATELHPLSSWVCSPERAAKRLLPFPALSHHAGLIQSGTGTVKRLVKKTASFLSVRGIVVI